MRQPPSLHLFPFLLHLEPNNSTQMISAPDITDKMGRISALPFSSQSPQQQQQQQLPATASGRRPEPTETTGINSYRAANSATENSGDNTIMSETKEDSNGKTR
ncbi:suppressor of tumorigenicity protein 7-like protein [Plakobranchus ocellatus]|uniref:Suppressor of tumorigenicity protein 7-like protein n=1 Tax=Plakobranchus ocellatus TaxID=259542 RepID=A0AAV3YRK8_9GAST|nr:suppressor of tumorigenicity protein 7-like protein [Plakobranchus ocellatus]